MDITDQPTAQIEPPANRYQHKSLPKGSCHIRLLTVHSLESDDVSEKSVLRGTLVDRDLDSKPQFTALSYVWGVKDSKSPVISIDGQDLVVTRNCYQALHDLRQTLGYYTIWVDAICINQQDPEEQAHQVGLMGRIYSDAATTYIWLGPGSAATDRAVTCLNAIGFPELLARKSSQGDWRDGLQRRWRHGLASSHLGSPDLSSAPLLIMRGQKLYYKDIAGLLQADWLERIWTYQEILLSKNPILVQGRMHLHWDTFSLGVLTLETLIPSAGPLADFPIDSWINLILDREMSDSTPEVVVYPSSNIVDSMKPLHQYRRLMRQMATSSPIQLLCFVSLLLALFIATMVWVRRRTAKSFAYGFCSLPVVYVALNIAYRKSIIPQKLNYERRSQIPGLVYALIRRQATFRKDYNYGIRGLLEKSLQHSLPVLEPDLSESNVFRDLALQILKATRCGFILEMAAIQKAHDCPSWVPSWSVGCLKPSDLFQNIRTHWHHKGATRGSAMHISFEKIESGILLIRGVEIADVVTVYPTFSRISIKQKAVLAEHLIAKWERVCVKDRSRWPDDFDGGARYRRLHLRKLHVERQVLETHAKLLDHDPETYSQTAPKTRHIDSIAEFEERSFEADWVLFDAERGTRFPKEPRRVWETASGNSNVQVGDKIILLSGVTTPLVARPSAKGGYTLVSPAHRLDAAMTGSFWNAAPEDKYPYLEIR